LKFNTPNTPSHKPEEKMHMVKTAKPPNPVARLDAIIAGYERLREEADAIIDAYVEELRETHPGIPAASLRVLAITNRAGSAMNVAAAMKLIRKTLVGERHE
jgi:hypothetical protein